MQRYEWVHWRVDLWKFLDDLCTHTGELIMCVPVLTAPAFVTNHCNDVYRQLLHTPYINKNARIRMAVHHHPCSTLLTMATPSCCTWMAFL